MPRMKRLVALGFCVLTGCGGSVTGSPEHDGGAADSAADSGTSWDMPDAGGPWSPVCPTSVPAIDSPCSAGALVTCEYGDAWWDVSCNTVFTCSSGTWIEDHPSSQTCFAAPAPNSSSCPASPTDIHAGTDCSDALLTCYYGMGAYCQCGGSINPEAAVIWACGPTAGCPSTRPRLGATCSSGEMCYYGDSSGFFESCVDGFWQAEQGGGAP